MRYSTRYVKERKNKDLIVAEIGVWSGENAQEMLDNLDIKKLYLVDPYQQYSEEANQVISQARLNDVKLIASKRFSQYDRAEQVLMPSVKAAETLKSIGFDFVYIDGNHSHPCIDEDVQAWYPLIKLGGVLAGHDYSIPDVCQAVDEFAKKQSLNLLVIENDWILVKEGKDASSS